VARGRRLNADKRLSPNQPAYEARRRRIVDLAELRQPARMPMIPYATVWIAKYAASSDRELMLGCAFGLPDEAPGETVAALFATWRKYAG
jgi:hypothetical protein